MSKIVNIKGILIKANSKFFNTKDLFDDYRINNILSTPITFVVGVLFCNLRGKYSILWNIVIIFENLINNDNGNILKN